MVEIPKRMAVKVPEGTVYVIVQRAERSEVGSWNSRRVETLGRVELTTDPEPPEGAGWRDRPKGYIKIRGRRYQMNHYYQRVPEFESWDGRKIRWQSERPLLNDGYRNDRGQEVGHDTAARKRLDEIATQVLDQFERENPGWARESERMALLIERSSWKNKAGDARAELDSANEEIAKIDKLLADF